MSEKMSEQESTVRTLHDSAMNVACEAHMRYLEAYRAEKKAFEIVAALPAEGREPTFSILCSSAAWLAFKADLPHSAVELAQRGLTEGKPSDYHRRGLEWCIEWSKRMIEEKG